MNKATKDAGAGRSEPALIEALHQRQFPAWTVTFHIALPEAGYGVHPSMHTHITTMLKGRAPVVYEGNGRLGITFASEAETGLAAQREGADVAEKLLADLGLDESSLLGFSIVDNTDLLREASSFPDIVGAGEVAIMLGVSRQRVHQLAARPDFPEPVRKLRATMVWRGVDIRAYAARRKMGASGPRQLRKV